MIFNLITKAKDLIYKNGKNVEEVLDGLEANSEHLCGYDASTIYDDIPSMVLAIHSSLENYESVCKNFRYSTNSALVIGNRFSATRGRYLVMPRTNVVVYIYQIKDGGTYNERTIATTEDLTEIIKANVSVLRAANTPIGTDVVKYFEETAIDGISTACISNPVNAYTNVQSWFTFYKIGNYGRIEQRQINNNKIYVKSMSNGIWHEWDVYTQNTYIDNTLLAMATTEEY